MQGRSVHTYNMLVETHHVCKPLKNPDSVYSVLDNQLVYLSGKLSTSGPVSDPNFGVSGKKTMQGAAFFGFPLFQHYSFISKGLQII